MSSLFNNYQIHPPIFTGSDVETWQINAEDQSRRRVIENLNQSLIEEQKNYFELISSLDKELNEVIAQARKDAIVRAWSTGLKLLSASLYAADQWSRAQDDQGLVSQGRSNKEEQTIRITRWAGQQIEVSLDGEWKTIDYHATLEQAIINIPVKNFPVGNLQSSLSSAKFLPESITQMSWSDLSMDATVFEDFLNRDWGVPHCYSELGACFIADKSEQIGDLYSIKIPPNRDPTPDEKDLYKQLASFKWTAATTIAAASVVADFTPGLTKVKSVIEVITGVDPITGREISKNISAIGLLPFGKFYKRGRQGVKFFIKRGSTAVSSVKQLLKNPMKIEGMTLEQVRNLIKTSSGRWITEPLGKGIRKGKPLKEGGGVRFREIDVSGRPTGVVIRWHPGSPGNVNLSEVKQAPYWTVSYRSKKSQFPAGQ